MKNDLMWSLKIEGVTEKQIRQMKVKDIKHSGVISLVDSNTGRKINFLLSDRVNNKLIYFAKNKKSDDLLFPEEDTYKKLTSFNNNKKIHKQKVCLAD